MKKSFPKPKYAELTKKCGVCGLEFYPRRRTDEDIRHNETIFKMHLQSHIKERWS